MPTFIDCQVVFEIYVPQLNWNLESIYISYFLEKEKESFMGEMNNK